MSDSSTDGMSDAQDVQTVEKTRNTVRDTAITQDAHRDAANLVARNKAYIDQEVAKAEANARKRVGQAGLALGESAEDSIQLRRHLAAERKAASTATFSLIIASILLLVAIVAGGAYYLSSQNNPGAAPGVTPGTVASTASPSRSTDVATPDRTPSAIHVNSAQAAPAPDVHVNTSGLDAPNGESPGSGGAAPIDLSGAALGSDGANSGEVVTPAADGPTPDTKSSP